LVGAGRQDSSVQPSQLLSTRSQVESLETAVQVVVEPLPCATLNTPDAVQPVLPLSNPGFERRFVPPGVPRNASSK
jgi:hypothetical protein